MEKERITFGVGLAQARNSRVIEFAANSFDKHRRRTAQWNSQLLRATH